MSWRIPKSRFSSQMTTFWRNEQGDRWTSPNTWHLEGISQSWGTAPLACSPPTAHPGRDKHPCPGPKGDKERALLSCWLTFLSVCRTALQTLEEPCEVSSYQPLFLWDVRAKQACETETRTQKPLCACKGCKRIWVAQSFCSGVVAGTDQSPETFHHTSCTVVLLPFCWYSSW